MAGGEHPGVHKIPPPAIGGTAIVVIKSFAVATVAVDEENILGADAVAAEGTRRVLVEPRVHAVGVKCVAAFGQQPQHLLRLEAGEADGALEAVFLAAEGGEAEERQLLDHFLVDSGIDSGEREADSGVGAERPGFAMLHVDEQYECDCKDGGDGGHDHGYARLEGGAAHKRGLRWRGRRGLPVFLGESSSRRLDEEDENAEAENAPISMNLEIVC